MKDLDTLIEERTAGMWILPTVALLAALGLMGFGVAQAVMSRGLEGILTGVALVGGGVVMLGASGALVWAGRRMAARERGYLSGPSEDIVWLYLRARGQQTTLVLAHVSGRQVRIPLPNDGGGRHHNLDAYTPLLDEVRRRYPFASEGYTPEHVQAYRNSPASLRRNRAAGV